VISLKIGVLADDLTGAFDTGVQYRNWGLSVEVFIGNVKEVSKLDGVDVVVVDTESRELKKEDAFIRVYHATEELTKLGVESIYKKIDSTLRGNIGIELDAAMEASKINFTFFAPAYPTYKRTTLSGKQYVDNKPLNETEYVDELGVKTAKISTLIGKQSKRKVGLVGFDTVNRGVDSIKTRIETLKRNGVEIAVFDALTEKHLIDIVGAAGDTRMFVGSAGLASEMPLNLNLRSQKPVLSVCGSTRRISRVQVRSLQDRLGFKEVEIGVLKLIDGEAAANAEIERCVSEAVAVLKAGVDVSITSSPKDDSAKEFASYALQRGLKETNAKLIVEEAIGEITSTILKEVEVLCLIVTGGATSLIICKKLGVDVVHIVEEIEPGIPLITLSNGMHAVTKAGGFGHEDSLIQATQRLRRLMAR
jgi:D-threonate/D-erythronate kinase